MSQSVSLSLPLSATALREGAEFLTKLSALAEVIREESGLAYAPAEGQTRLEKKVEVLGQQYTSAPAADPVEDSFEADVVVAEQAVVTQETLPPVQYETVVVGVERNPEYIGHLAEYEPEALIEAGWTNAALITEGYLREVTEQRPLPVAPSASADTGAAPTPAAPAPGALPTSSGVEVDKDGLPWDSRIHSDAAERMAKSGYWKTRRNLPDGYKEQVEAELRAVMAAGKPAAPTAPEPASAITATAAPTPPAPPAPSATPAPVTAPAPAAPAAGNPFAEFTRWILEHTNAKRMTSTDVCLEVQKQGLTTIPDLAKRHDLIPIVKANLIATRGLPV